MLGLGNARVNGILELNVDDSCREDREGFIVCKYDELGFIGNAADDQVDFKDLPSVLRSILLGNTVEDDCAVFNAIQEGSFAAALLLIYWGAPTSHVHPATGDTCLHILARHDHLASSPAFLVGLVRRGALLDAKNASGQTPLDLAVASGNAAMATLLRVLEQERPKGGDFIQDHEFEQLDIGDSEPPSGKGARRKRLLSKLQQLYPSAMVPLHKSLPK
jgi:hypothetical protein